MSAFFDETRAQRKFFVGDTNPYGLTTEDWAALVAIATARHEKVSAYRQKPAAELCLRSTAIDTQAQLAVALTENVSSARELAGTYDKKLYSELSLEGRSIVDRYIDTLVDTIHTVDLDYATYLVAASIEPAEYFHSACPPPSVAQESTESQIPRDDSRRARPDALPLAVYVGPECPVSTELVRESAEGAISRESIKPLGWPALQENSSWFGAYVGLECTQDSDAAFVIRTSLTDSTDGSLLLSRAFVDGSYGWILGLPHPGPVSYSSFVSQAVGGSVSEFLRRRFEP